MRLGLAAAGFAALMGAAQAQTVIDGSDAQVPQELLAGAMKVMGSKMADPLAVQLRGLKAMDMPKRGGAAICGEMNAKNLNGAYIGFHPFLYAPNDPNPTQRFVVTGNERDPSLRAVMVQVMQAVCA